jgi:hypothetical protein
VGGSHLDTADILAIAWLAQGFERWRANANPKVRRDIIAVTASH